MKIKLLMLSALVGFQSISAQTSSKNKLNGTSFEYEYTNQSAIEISFSMETLTYRWTKGPNAAKSLKTYNYKSRLVGPNTYYVSWHEVELNNFITLIFDFNQMEAFSSVIVNYGNQNSFTTFDQANITKLMRENATLPYKEIPEYSPSYAPGNVLSRLVDGLGYRYHWATEGLTEEDLAYQPSIDARNTRHTLEHVLGLSETILNSAKNVATIRPMDLSKLTFEELRQQTLTNLEKASNLYRNKSSEEIAKLKVIFQSPNQTRTFPFWNMINGPISDAIFHTGQIVSFRRSSGNPINPKVSVFLGKNRE